MAKHSQFPLIVEAEDDALTMILEGTAKVTGEAFFAALVENLSKALNTHSAWITAEKCGDDQRDDGHGGRDQNRALPDVPKVKQLFIRFVRNILMIPEVRFQFG